jgi:hypothetical protein
MKSVRKQKSQPMIMMMIMWDCVVKNVHLGKGDGYGGVT